MSVQGLCTQKACQDCFPKFEHRSREIIDLIHSDVGGPMSSACLTGSLYYVVFIEDSSRKTRIYFMKKRDEVFSKFTKFKALFENQTGHFDAFCREAGFKRALTVPYNHNRMGLQRERSNPS